MTVEKIDSNAEILIVEDTPESLRLLTEVLESAGYTVRQAQDGAMALATVHSRLPDLILLDIAMPGMNGYEVCHRLTTNPETRSVPVIFCSALHDTDYKIQGFSQGAVDFITKPYQPEEVLMRVKTHLELYRLRHQLEQRVKQRTARLNKLTDNLKEEIKVRKKAEQELRLSSKAFDSSFSSIMVTDSKGIIVAVNPAFTRITGYSKKEALGKTPRLIKSGEHDAKFYHDIWTSINERGTWSGEIWNRRKNGDVIPMMESINAVRDADGQVTHYVATLADLSESKDAKTLISFLTYHDSLTGLSNQLVARKHFEKAVFDADKSQSKVALINIDLDRFKVVNDSLGHGVGDQILKKMARDLGHFFGENQLVFRESGDEFLIILSELSNVNQVTETAEKLVTKLRDESKIGNHSFSTTASIGIALYPDDGDTFDDLLKASENALYKSKQKGGNDFCLFQEYMNSEARLRLELENGLRNAILNNEFRLLYQPKIKCGDNTISGAEVLIRWENPVLGLVSPASFIPLAEETGLVLSIDEWVLNTVCQQIQTWKGEGLDIEKISVNLSTLQFRRGDLLELIQGVLHTYQLMPSCIDLEITETVFMHNIHEAVSILENLKALGLSISLDDFGTGYSSLNYLRKLPIDTLKIDKSFIDEIHVNTHAATIASSIINLGHNLGLMIVAEGVEYEQQYKLLSQQGCDEIQGYYFSKPLNVNDFEQALRGEKLLAIG